MPGTKSPSPTFYLTGTFTFTEPLTPGEISTLESLLRHLEQGCQFSLNREMVLETAYNTEIPDSTAWTTTAGAMDLSSWLERRPTDELWESEQERGREKDWTRGDGVKY